MQTAYVIHMSEAPSIRKVITTSQVGTFHDDVTTLSIAVVECDDKWEAKDNPRVLQSTAKRRPWGWLNRVLNKGMDDETLYHQNLRAQLRDQYNWRFELYPALSDPL